MKHLKVFLRKLSLALMAIILAFVMIPSNFAFAGRDAIKFTITKATEDNEEGEFKFKVKTYNPEYDLVFDITTTDAIDGPQVFLSKNTESSLNINGVNVDHSGLIYPANATTTEYYSIYEYLTSLSCIKIYEWETTVEGCPTNGKIIVNGVEYDLFHFSSSEYLVSVSNSINGSYGFSTDLTTPSAIIYKDDAGNEIYDKTGIYEFTLSSGESKDIWMLQYGFFEILEESQNGWGQVSIVNNGFLQQGWFLSDVDGDKTMTKIEGTVWSTENEDELKDKSYQFVFTNRKTPIEPEVEPESESNVAPQVAVPNTGENQASTSAVRTGVIAFSIIMILGRIVYLIRKYKSRS